jgi:hypothetical protein
MNTSVEPSDLDQNWLYSQLTYEPSSDEVEEFIDRVFEYVRSDMGVDDARIKALETMFDD